jgi:hypothetical protein
MWLDQGGQAAKLTGRFDLHSYHRNSSRHSEATSLVPLERHHAISRRLFISGILLGALAAVAITVAAFRYSNGSSNNESADAAVPAPAIPPSSIPELKTPMLPGPSSISVVPASQQGFQHRAQLSLAVGSSKESAFLPIRPQTGAPIPAGHPVLWTSTPQARNVAVKNDSRAKSAATTDELWSGVRAGNVHATIALADRFARGDGVSANCEQARVLLTMASKKGSTEAARRLQQLDNTCSPTAPQ